MKSPNQGLSTDETTPTCNRLPHRQCGWRLWMKVGLDRCAAFCGLLLFSPLLVLASILVWLSVGSPILFHQKRPGRFGKPFKLHKFRTMSQQLDARGMLLPDEVRLTRVGKILRATSIDELPQLWNVLCGDISLVGPRPLLMEYLPRYSSEQARRHDVLPGITGWAQINGRNALTWDEKFAFDIWYVDHWSPKLDCLIFIKTFASVVNRSGITSSSHATMPEFTASRASHSRSENGASGLHT